MSSLDNLYGKFKINYQEDGEQAHQMELARRRYKEHQSKTTPPKR